MCGNVRIGGLYFEKCRPLPLGLPSFLRNWIKVEHGFLLATAEIERLISANVSSPTTEF